MGREVEAVVGEKALEELSHWRRYFSLAGPARLRVESTMTTLLWGIAWLPWCSEHEMRPSFNSKWSQEMLGLFAEVRNYITNHYI